MPSALPEIERQFRQARMDELIAGWMKDPDRRDPGEVIERRTEAGKQALVFLNEFQSPNGNGPDFREAIDHWSRGNTAYGFAGPNGAMFLNQLINDGMDGGIEEVLRNLLPVPENLDAACKAIERLATFVKALREKGSAAQMGRSPYFLSWFWSLQDPVTWRPMWPSVEKSFKLLGWVDKYRDSLTLRFEQFYQSLNALSGDVIENEEVLSWYPSHTNQFGVDETLRDRCLRAMNLRRDAPNETASAADAEEYAENVENLRAALAEMNRLGNLGQGVVASELQTAVQINVSDLFWYPAERRLRGNLWLSWLPKFDQPCPGIRYQIGPQGGHFILNPEINRNRKGYANFAIDIIRDNLPLGWTFYNPGQGLGLSDLNAVSQDESHTNFNIGRKVDPETLSSAEVFLNAVKTFVEEAKPVLAQLVETVDAPNVPVAATEPTDLDLLELKERFLMDREYPKADDLQNTTTRIQWADLLSSTKLASLSKATFRQMYAGRYGSPGPQAILNSTIRDADDSEWERLLASVDLLLWGEADVAERIDRVMDESDLGFRGLKEGVIMKLLAIADPDRFIPVFPFSGTKGKAAMLQKLGRSAPSLTNTVGQRQVEANDSLRTIVEPLFPGDPWGQMEFLYWILESPEEADLGEEPDSEAALSERLTDMAQDTYLDVGFLEDIVELLRIHRQVVFYGPPGTGKTFIAQALADAVAPDPERRMLVQFHPSTSYEDFFEGYRPYVSESGGGITYRLTPGPLKSIADAAESDPDHIYILIIDEINRANLPKVLGELLFLLEYRGKSVKTLYRPDVDYRLPSNLWILGTMNGADRSIALVDAALRRRFQFVPFIPDVEGRSPISGVLRRWVEDTDELETLPDIVDAVNNRLRVDLGGDHLLLGPSYFMKAGIDENGLRRIWEYQIEPLIEDLFYGEPGAVQRYRFQKIWKEYGQPQVTDEPDAAGSGSEHSPGSDPPASEVVEE